MNGFESHGSGNDSSITNHEEAIVLVSFLEAFLEAQARSASPHPLLEDIGVITPFSAQVKKVERMLSDQGVTGIMVGSVNKFQGSEKEFILISTVRSNEKCGIGFLKEERRLNVAITRS